MRRKPVRSSEKKFFLFQLLFLFQGFCPAVGWDKISTDISTDTSAVRVSMSEDSGGAVMGRGDRSGDVQRLENFFQSARDWGMQEDRQEQPLQQHQFESEGESGDHDDDDNQPLHLGLEDCQGG